MARSLSEVVQQLFTDDQLNKDCARALSLQVASYDTTKMQQMHGVLLHALASLWHTSLQTMRYMLCWLATFQDLIHLVV